jgi:hypothetical protein
MRLAADIVDENRVVARPLVGSIHFLAETCQKRHL